MFDKQYRFRGRHAVRVDKLTGVFDTNSKAKLFERNVDVYANCGLFRTFQENSRLKDPSFTTPCTKEKVISLHTLC